MQMHNDERIAQTHAIVNRLIGKYKETRKRNLVLTVRRSVSACGAVSLFAAAGLIYS
jgi:hypothetical protein